MPKGYADIPLVSDQTRRLLGPLGFLVVLFLLLLLFCLIMQEKICGQPEYYVLYENIRVSCTKEGEDEAQPIPAWVEKNFVNEVLELLPPQYKRSSLDAATPDSAENVGWKRRPDEVSAGIPEPGRSTVVMNSNDPRLVENLRNAFLSHHLVADVKDIVVYYPGRVDVLLTFREPVAVIDATTKAYDEFRGFLEKEFPNDFRDLCEFESAPSTLNATERAQLRGERNEQKGNQYLIDKTGNLLRSDYFVNHRDAYAALPVVVGFTTSESGVAADTVFADAGAFLRFLDESGACRDFRIRKIGAMRGAKTRRPVWYLWLDGDEEEPQGRVVRWGRFVPRVSPGPGVPARGDWTSLCNFQRQKLTELQRLFDDADAEIARLRRSPDPAEQESAESPQLRKFDVASLLIGQETEE